jgi:hypothetical protein
VSLLSSAERPWPEQQSISWIGKIRSEFAWEKLRKLRRIALTSSLSSTAGLITETMKNINLAGTATVIRQQIMDSPEGWRVAQTNIADTYDKEARLARAVSIPFDKVIRKLVGNTSLITMKVWCEGKTDVPVIRELMRNIGVSEIVYDNVNGWPGLQGKQPERLLDGCREVFVVMDGDLGRTLSKRQKPLTKLAREIKQRLDQHAIPLRVLERYGIENYFSRTALESVLSMDLSQYFPFPDNVPCGKHLVADAARSRFARLFRSAKQFVTRRQSPSFYRKELNEKVIAAMKFDEIADTDLGRICEEIKAKMSSVPLGDTPVA